MKQVMNCHKDNGLLNMIRTDPMIINLVSKDKRPTMPGRIWQHECDGWYIYSNISNGTKAEDLKRISDHYHLGLKIEEGKPE